MNEKTALEIEKRMIELGAIVLPNGTTISDWLMEGDADFISSATIAELVAEWNEDLA